MTVVYLLVNAPKVEMIKLLKCCKICAFYNPISAGHGTFFGLKKKILKTCVLTLSSLLDKLQISTVLMPVQLILEALSQIGVIFGAIICRSRQSNRKSRVIV